MWLTQDSCIDLCVAEGRMFDWFFGNVTKSPVICQQGDARLVQIGFIDDISRAADCVRTEWRINKAGLTANDQCLASMDPSNNHIYRSYSQEFAAQVKRWKFPSLFACV